MPQNFLCPKKTGLCGVWVYELLASPRSPRNRRANQRDVTDRENTWTREALPRLLPSAPLYDFPAPTAADGASLWKLDPRKLACDAAVFLAGRPITLRLAWYLRLLTAPVPAGR